MKYTAYLFDFDYTLADSSAGIVLCFRIILDAFITPTSQTTPSGAPSA